MTSFNFHGSFKPSDITFLLTLLDKNEVLLVDTTQKEALIQTGTNHYSTMLTPETAISDEHLAIYHQTKAKFALRTAQDIHHLAYTLFHTFIATNKPLILVSLARAGVPIGVLLKRAFDDPLSIYHRPCLHYGISIIRDKGIDAHALKYIIDTHPNCPIVFVDGWTGKGAIFQELQRSLHTFCQKNPHCQPYIFHQGNDTVPLVVQTDPAKIAWLSADNTDWLMPASMLNATISGLISRSIYQENRFHGCIYYKEFEAFDESLNFIQDVNKLRQKLTNQNIIPPNLVPQFTTYKLIDAIAKKFNITNGNLIKPTLAEAARAIIRRQPKCVILGAIDDDTLFIRHLCQQKNIAWVLEDIFPYKAITVIEKRA